MDFFADQVATALLYADYLFCNEGEAAAYGKKHGYGEDLKEVALKIASSEKKDPSTIRCSEISCPGDNGHFRGGIGRDHDRKLIHSTLFNLVWSHTPASSADDGGGGQAFVNILSFDRSKTG